MNTDRFLTRVFDRKRGIMSYAGDEIYIETLYRDYSNKKDCQRFEDKAVLCTYRACYTNYDNSLRLICESPTGNIILSQNDDGYYAERFIAMQCTGVREDNRKDGKLVYEFDILKTHMGELVLILLKDACWVANLIRSKKILKLPVTDLATLEGRFSVVGNKFENPELLEEN